jgi:hypothetical protein
VYEPTPPVALNDVAGYEVPTAPLGTVLVVIDRAEAVIVIASCFVAVCGVAALSFTATTKVYVFTVVGVPLKDPAPDKLRPGGSEPD